VAISHILHHNVGLKTNPTPAYDFKDYKSFISTIVVSIIVIISTTTITAITVVIIIIAIFTSVLNIGYRRYTSRQNCISDTGYQVIYRDMILNTS